MKNEPRRTRPLFSVVVVVVDVAASTVVAAEAIGNDGVTIFVVVKKASVVGVVRVLEVGKERRVAVVLF